MPLPARNAGSERPAFDCSVIASNAGLTTSLRAPYGAVIRACVDPALEAILAYGRER